MWRIPTPSSASASYWKWRVNNLSGAQLSRPRQRSLSGDHSPNVVITIGVCSSATRYKRQRHLVGLTIVGTVDGPSPPPGYRLMNKSSRCQTFIAARPYSQHTDKCRCQRSGEYQAFQAASESAAPRDRSRRRLFSLTAAPRQSEVLVCFIVVIEGDGCRSVAMPTSGAGRSDQARPACFVGRPVRTSAIGGSTRSARRHAKWLRQLSSGRGRLNHHGQLRDSYRLMGRPLPPGLATSITIRKWPS